ncbi:olfactory receptor 1G1-like [Alligator mississippiensis]|uniref:Olfactory receptor 1G1-like n=2 Tax=Alligator mississippiensis TaxID=8496 RepID=A0A151NKN5_ALLMI|nr:olfactory receptor 1G1-like [Alligator mississippiensis]
MYILLGHLALADAAFACTTAPTMLGTLLYGDQAVPWAGCLAQMYFFIAFAITDSFFLAALTYDHYAAICHPLHYPVLMSPKHCRELAAGAWTLPHPYALTHTLLMAQLNSCGQPRVPHFSCDTTPLLELACSDPRTPQAVIFSLGVLVVLTPITCVVLSYAHILSSVLQVPSAAGKCKAFSTCGSHLAVVTLFYGAVLGLYFRPATSYVAQQDMVANVLYAVVTPIVNPFLYSLRSTDMRKAVQRVFKRSVTHRGQALP